MSVGKNFLLGWGSCLFVFGALFAVWFGFWIRFDVFLGALSCCFACASMLFSVAFSAISCCVLGYRKGLV